MANLEAPNNLISNQRIRILDLIGEGTEAGFWRVSGVSGSNPLCSMYMDDTPILNGDGSPNFNISGQGFSWGYVSGTSSQGVMTGFNKVEALIPLPINSRVTFPPENEGFSKPVVVAFNTTMYPDAEAVKVTMRIPSLFTVDMASGDTNGYNIGWIVEIQLNGGPWQVVDTQNIVGKCTSPFLKTLIYTLPKSTPATSFYEWKVRVRRTTRFIASQRTANDLYVDTIAVVSSNSYRYPMSAMVGLSLSADQFAGIPSRAYDIKGIQVLVPEGYTPTQYNETTFTRQCDYDAGNKLIGFTTQSAAQTVGVVPGTIVSGPGIPVGSYVVSIDNDGPSYFFAINNDPTSTLVNQTVTFNTSTPGIINAAVYPSIWTGVFGARKWTDNPAWIFYDLCTNKRYGLGNYIRPEWMDKFTLYQIAQYCDEMVDDGAGGLEPRFTCNVAIQQSQDAYSLLNNLVSVFRGMLYWANGRIYPVGSQTTGGKFNFTNANVIGGSFSYSNSPKNTRSTVCLVKWVDPDNLFRTAVERVEDPSGISKYGVITKEITAFATTSRGQAVRVANWILTVEQLLTETITFQTDMEGLYLRPGNVVNVYDNYRNNLQQGGRILSFSNTRDFVELDRTVAIQSGFYYSMSVLMPATTLGTGITGSNQIDALQSSQIETRTLLTGPTPSIQFITVESGFSSNLYKGSVWILSASGGITSVFDKATQYKVLGTSEPSNGVVEIVGVQYNTGINFVVNNNYSSEVSPVIVGDTTPPDAPSNLTATRITGLLNDNSFYSYAYLDWDPSPSVNAAYYRVSGQYLSGPPSLIGLPPANQTNINYTPGSTGQYTFYVGAFNANGYGSSFISANYTEPGTNPLPAAPLSGIFIAQNYDIYSSASSLGGKYTGYIGNVPTFGWAIQRDAVTDLEVPSAQFITGYRVRVVSATGGNFNLSTPVVIEGKDNTLWAPDSQFLYTGTSVKPLRSFTLAVDILDSYGNTVSGARLVVNNSQPKQPVSSGFVGFAGGVNYTITPAGSDDVDVSGVYIWTNTGTSFVPSLDSPTYISTNLAGAAPSISVGGFYTWFALVDSYGPSGSIISNGDYNSRIYGPISGNAVDIGKNIFASQFDLTATGQRLSAVKVTGSSIINIADFTGNNNVSVIQSGSTVLVSGPSAAILQGDGTDVNAVGFRGIPQIIASGNFVITGSYNGKHLYKQPSDNTISRITFTGNSTLPLPIGFVVTLVNDSITGSTIISTASTDTMVLVGVGIVTGTITLAETGIATALKVGTTRWQINGNILTST